MVYLQASILRQSRIFRASGFAPLTRLKSCTGPAVKLEALYTGRPGEDCFDVACPETENPY